MAHSSDTTSMALFCDFENIALGVRDAKYDKFDIRPVLERLLAKGSIVVKKAYCDWDRYKAFKAAMHEANFELIEIPHVRQSGKNSADIRMVVDALDLCYTKAHVDTFVIISGDSDFSPLVSKLRENAKQVVGVGVKQSTSDLLIANCDEFIFYDDLVREREAQRVASRREQAPRRSPEEEKRRREEMEARRLKAVELAVATFDDLIAVRGDAERIWASQLKEAIKRRNPGFNESYFGFRTFGALLDDAAARGGLGVGRDEKSGTFVVRASQRLPISQAAMSSESPETSDTSPETTGSPAETQTEALFAEQAVDVSSSPAPSSTSSQAPEDGHASASRRRGRRTKKEKVPSESPASGTTSPSVEAKDESPAPASAMPTMTADGAQAPESAASARKPKTAARNTQTRRGRKPKTGAEEPATDESQEKR